MYIETVTLIPFSSRNPLVPFDSLTISMVNIHPWREDKSKAPLLLTNPTAKAPFFVILTPSPIPRPLDTPQLLTTPPLPPTLWLPPTPLPQLTPLLSPTPQLLTAPQPVTTLQLQNTSQLPITPLSYVDPGLFPSQLIPPR